MIALCENGIDFWIFWIFGTNLGQIWGKKIDVEHY